jgi:hypothetical protein
VALFYQKSEKNDVSIMKNIKGRNTRDKLQVNNFNLKELKMFYYIYSKISGELVRKTTNVEEVMAAHSAFFKVVISDYSYDSI